MTKQIQRTLANTCNDTLGNVIDQYLLLSLFGFCQNLQIRQTSFHEPQHVDKTVSFCARDLSTFHIRISSN